MLMPIKSFTCALVVVVSLFFVMAIALAESSLSPWPFFAEVTPRPGEHGIYQFVAPVQVLGKAREDLADLRLIDAGGREIPYALQIRREDNEQREIGTRLFNRATVAGATEVSIDLGENTGEHNEIQIESTGSNFRRRVEVEGSDNASNWRTLTTSETIFKFESQNRAVNANRISYPLSRYRYLRLRVHTDDLTDKSAPDITSVRAMRVARDPELLTTWDAGLSPYQLLRNQGAPASSWAIDLGGTVPCDRLYLTLADESFSRQFQVEATDNSQDIRVVASGELTRRVGERDRPVRITFDDEVYARKLRLLVTDYNNPTLAIQSVQAAAPARQIFFELKEPAAQPLRLFFGNANANAPHYDFEKELAARITSAPVPVTVGSFSSNPDYRPEPLPFTERVPWMIYVVLTISSLALALVLLSLARSTMRLGRDSASSAKPTQS